MKSAIWTFAGVLTLVLLAAPVTMLMIFMKGSSDSAQVSCGPGEGGQLIQVASRTDIHLSDVQLRNASIVIAVGREMDIPTRGQVVALAVANQESRFLNYANSGNGAGLRPDQHGVAQSLSLPHDAVGNDHGSVGIFQQQFPWWGSLEELMDPASAARKFYEKLLLVPGWQQMSPTSAGQAVQRSAYPNAYADDVPLALNLLSNLGAGDISTDGHSAGLATVGACATGATHPGSVVMPIAQEAGAIDRHNWNSSGGMWARGHTGTDFSVGCGTPVRAATDGVVRVRTDQPWAGRWLVQVSTGEGRLTTWYAHMQSLEVTDGSHVSAGQTIGEVGSEGNSTGCHLHFEVHPRGGSIYQDDVNPSEWLAENVGRNIAKTLPASSAAGSGAASIITTNIRTGLSRHDAAAALRHVLDQSPDVVLVQEMHGRNLKRMLESLPGSWGSWQPPQHDRQDATAVVWNADKFNAVRQGVELGTRIQEDRWISWVLLQDGAGNSLPVASLHMPHSAWRNQTARRGFVEMMSHYRALSRQFTRAGYSLIAGGDWNLDLVEHGRPWGVMRQLRDIGYTTNWSDIGNACKRTGPTGGRIDGFAYHRSYVEVVTQGCLDRAPTDHRPVWIQVQPATAS